MRGAKSSTKYVSSYVYCKEVMLVGCFRQLPVAQGHVNFVVRLALPIKHQAIRDDVSE
jgi:hypothetical protein